MGGAGRREKRAVALLAACGVSASPFLPKLGPASGPLAVTERQKTGPDFEFSGNPKTPAADNPTVSEYP